MKKVQLSRNKGSSSRAFPSYFFFSPSSLEAALRDSCLLNGGKGGRQEREGKKAPTPSIHPSPSNPIPKFPRATQDKKKRKEEEAERKAL